MTLVSSRIPDRSWDLKIWKTSSAPAGTFAKLARNFPSIPSSESRLIQSFEIQRPLGKMSFLANKSA